MLSADPTRTTPVYPSDDTDRPEAERVRFIYRFLTCSEFCRRADLRDEGEAAKNNRDALAKFIAAASIGLVGWENLTDPDGKPIPYTGDPAAMADALTPVEMSALLDATAEAVQLTEQKKRRGSSSLSITVTDSSAPSAPAPAAV